MADDDDDEVLSCVQRTIKCGGEIRRIFSLPTSKTQTRHQFWSRNKQFLPMLNQCLVPNAYW